MICVGFLPKDASLRDAPLVLLVIPQNSYSREHPIGMQRIVRFKKELFDIIISWHEPPGFVFFVLCILPYKGVHAYTLTDIHIIVIVFSSYYLTFISWEV
jgi:hypothetical protein